MPVQGSRTWDVFCQRVDNFGDVGVSWRLAADLASRGETVRLWMDDPSPLRFMAPGGAAGVEIRSWPSTDAALGGVVPGEVVIETFGCQLPDGFVDLMLAREHPPVWINLEYLGLEDFARRSHGLPSPQHNGLPKWFFYPGLVAGTGGLLREPHLLTERASFDRDRWLQGLGSQRRPGERVVVLFCYENPALPSLLQALTHQPTLLLVTPGAAHQQVQQWRVDRHDELGELRIASLPWLTQREFDRALWSADLNCVRGEDSVVRALWAGAAVLWQLYPQTPEVRHIKLQAWWDHFFSNSSDACQSNQALRPWLDLHRRYNDLEAAVPGSELVLPDLAPWATQVASLRERLLQQADLCSQLQAFVTDKS
jgi:uncharacterized repeat protein (TIGR03837 family)